ncbi:MAG TPA: hypothetical protein VK569_11065, partial [Bacteroidota bacterium]|nr:hypothetical protein [Bacteroidota bacterium]
LSGRVRKGLGESIARISKANSPLPEATTSSLQALELYSRSENLANSGNYKDAAVLCQEAVSLDSEFVLAISRLAYSYRKIGQDSLAAVMHNRILPLIHRVSERERLDIFVNYYGPSFEIDFQKARESAVKLTLMYPHDADAFQYLGHLSMFAGDTKSALEANARAVSLDQGEEQTCFHNSAYALELANRSEEALDWFRKAKTLRPDYLSIDMNTALTYWSIGQIDSADTALVRAFGAATGHQRNQIRVLMISLDYFRGNLSAARALCREGLRECAILKRPWDEGYFHLLLGEIASAEGNMGEYRSQMSQAAGMSASPYADLALVGWSYARNGLQRDAERILTRIDAMRSYDPWFIRYRPGYRDLIRGEILLRNGDYAKSRVEFRNIEKVLSGDIIYCLGQLGLADCANRSSDANAPAFYDSLQSLRGETFLGSLFSVRRSGFWTRWLWPDAEFEVGKIYASRNQNTQAVEHLNRGLQFLKNADSGDRRASSARSLLVKITGGK